MLRNTVLNLIVLMVCTGSVLAVEDPKFVDHDTMLMDHGGGHMMDFGGGMVMGQNVDTMPMSCSSVEDEVEITVKAGRKYAEKFPGTMYSFDNHEWRVKPCTKITFHFINEDSIRHQLMIHGLPKYIYKSGMFHLEVTGPGKISGTIIVPKNDETYLVHCDISQHMEKGMKGQLVVGKGGVSLPSIPGVTPYAFPDSYDLSETEENSTIAGTEVLPGKPADIPPVQNDTVVQTASSTASGSLISGMLVIGLAFGLLGAPLIARKFEGMSKDEIYDYLAKKCTLFFNVLIEYINRLVQFLAVQLRKLSTKS